MKYMDQMYAHRGRNENKKQINLLTLHILDEKIPIDLKFP